MKDTLAKIVSAVLIKHGKPPRELLSPREVAGAVLSILARRLVQRSQSDQNQEIRRKGFTPDAREYSLAGVAELDQGTPLWVERRVSVSLDSWDTVYITNLDTLEESRLRGDMRCAFFGENDKLLIKFSYDAAGIEHKLYYDPNPQLSKTLDDKTGLPSHFNEMIVDEAVVKSQPLLIQHAAELETEDKPISKTQFLAWEQVNTEAKDSLKEWEKLWKNHVWDSSDSQKGRNRRNILGNHGGGVI
jgi:hypothetical protein